MADVVLFPGTEMEVNEKYPDSRRLDHPNFADVAKTTFAKGVITEFKQISADPIRVESMVKVTGSFGTSEGYIPIFYHPKAQYWDDLINSPTVMAQDYDETTGAYKQAWMSFRGDDEVVVMLKEGVPVAVLGFADGAPRIGESVFQMAYNTIAGTAKVCQWQPGVRGVPTEKVGRLYENFNVENMGPDGKAIGLVTESLIICDTGEQEQTKSEHDDFYYDHYIYDLHDGYEVLEASSDFTWTVQRRYIEYLVIVGPIAYIIQVLYTKLHTQLIYSHAGELVYHYWDPPHPTMVVNTDVTTYSSEISILSKLYSKQVQDDAIALGDSHNSLELFETDPRFRPDWADYFELDAVIVSDNPDWDAGEYYLDFGVRGVEWDGWLFNPDFSVRLFSACAQSDNTSLNQVDPATLKIYARPHTTAELQAAGILPV